MLKLNEPTRAKVCKTEDFPQRKQWLIKMDRVAPVAVNESLWYKLPFTNHLFTTVEPWTSLKRTLLLLTPCAKMPLWKVIRYPPSGSHDKSLCMNIPYSYGLPQDPQREGAHVQRNSISHKPEPQGSMKPQTSTCPILLPGSKCDLGYLAELWQLLPRNNIWLL